MTVRVRFAPSPTGYLHVGGARTALFNWLYARRVGGKFLLRIEDTDRARSSDEHTRIIKEGLAWLGLDWDEDIVFQGARLARHQEAARRLLKEDKAYEEEGAIRLRVPPGELAWDDAVHRRISFRGEDVRDFAILRSDGSPLYNFAVVVDDLDMRITHVLRGDDHISNTPKQLAVYRALGVEPPIFGHVPMLNGADGKKLSKRHGATAVGDYQHVGILPAAMRNFLALLGWSPGGDREILPLEEMVQLFSLDGIQKKPAIFDVVKLHWMNSQYISQSTATELLEHVKDELVRMGISPAHYGPRLLEVIDYVKARSHTTIDLVLQLAARLSRNHWLFDPEADQAIAQNHSTFIKAWQTASSVLPKIPEDKWKPDQLEETLRSVATASGMSTKDLFQPIRVAVSGSTVSEPVHQLLAGVGREEAVGRIQYLLNVVNVPSTSAHVSGSLLPPDLKRSAGQ